MLRLQVDKRVLLERKPYFPQYILYFPESQAKFTLIEVEDWKPHNSRNYSGKVVCRGEFAYQRTGYRSTEWKKNFHSIATLTKKQAMEIIDTNTLPPAHTL